MINEKFAITINGNKFEGPHGDFMTRNAQALLLAGHLRHLLTASKFQQKIDISLEDWERIDDALAGLEDWLQPAVSNFGDVVASIDIEEIGKFSLGHLGYAITAFSELLKMVQEVRYHFEHTKPKPETGQ